MQGGRKEGESAIAYFLKSVAQGAFAACVAEIITLPLDTAKVRLQIQKVEPGQKPRYSGLIGTAKTIAAEEGVGALFNGMIPGLQR